MPYINHIFPLLLCISITCSAISQKRPDPTFTTFKGDYYTMPIVEVRNKNRVSKRIQQKYGENIYDYKKLGEIELDEINIPETTIGSGKFPDVDRSMQFCMVLHSTMTIEVDGCYEFSLHSDDGSILWIDDEMVIDNDGGHQMQLTIDTVSLSTGEYPIKLWYFQGMPDRFGFIFDSKLIGKPSVCNKKVEIAEMKIQSNLFFNSGSYTLNIDAGSALSGILDTIRDRPVRSIDIIGHTDNVGNEEDNMILSQNRAEAIAIELRRLIINKDIIVNAIGRGEEVPIATNETSDGRSQNRRVEVVLRFLSGVK